MLAIARAATATNPESGSIQYSYDAAGNLSSRTDNRGWKTTYTYDALNRTLSKTYSKVTPGTDGVEAGAVNYLWDTVWIGQLSSVTSQATANAVASSISYTAYDHMGRVTASAQSTNGAPPHTFSYTYNLAGGLEAETYPSGRVVTACYDVAGRTKSLSGVLGQSPATHYTGTADITYAVHGAIQTLNRGDGLVEAWSHNGRLQPTGISVGTVAEPRKAFGTDLYYCPNQLASCVTNNGNLSSVELSVFGAVQNYTYDAFNRLKSAAETSAWARSWDYDPRGNGWVSSWTGLSPATFTPTGQTNFDGNNRLVLQGSGYDGAGSLSAIGGYGFVWDAEGRMVVSTINAVQTQYSYDGEGRRVQKQGPNGTTVYVYDAMGELAAEYGAAGASSCDTCYLSVDQLGSTRAVTNASGEVVERHDYLPFGEEIYAGTAGRTVGLKYPQSTDGVGAVTIKFTGKERDTEPRVRQCRASITSGRGTSRGLRAGSPAQTSLSPISMYTIRKVGTCKVDPFVKTIFCPQ